MAEWKCYLIMSLDSNDTYVGSSNNHNKRLTQHNNSNPKIKRQGARRTLNQLWIPFVIISGFESKNACLSFEYGWKRLGKRRTNKRLDNINSWLNMELKYTRNTKWNRMLDLLYFMHNFTFINQKFILNSNLKHPHVNPNKIKISVHLDEWVCCLPWPNFVSTKF